MKICREGHREIVFDEQIEDEHGIYGVCPLCEAEAKIFNQEKYIEELCKKLGYKKT